MDFFAYQDQARRQTWLLVLLLPLAVLVLLAALNGVYFFYTIMSLEWIKVGQEGSPYTPERWWLFNGAALAVIVGGTLYRFWTLRRGGEAVALAMGAIPIDAGAGQADPLRRRLLNVVEEMAVASGVPTPRVYLLEEVRAINAFAAGHTPGDAVVVVTQGALTLLTREELQGVAAHEFSHILNGDMHLNLRLMGLLYGIQLVAIIGQRLVEGPVARDIAIGLPTPLRPRLTPLLYVGYLLWLVGYLGVFAARLIKSAISRQREHLADAAAVQFTRNPLGLAGALLKIGGFSYGGRVRQAAAEEASHMFFGDSISSRRFVSWTATHPPLAERVRRLLPNFTGEFPHLYGAQWHGLPEAFDNLTGAAEHGLGGDVGVTSALAGTLPSRTDRAEAASEAAVGVTRPQPAHLAYAQQLLAALPPELLALSHQPETAQGVVLALLLSPEPAVRQRQEQALADGAGGELLAATRTAMQLLRGQPPTLRLPLVDLSITALRRLAAAALTRFLALVETLIQADQRVAPFEYVLQQLLRRHLRGSGDQGLRHTLHSFRKVTGPVALLLSLLARLGDRQPEGIARAFQAGVAKLGVELALTLRPAEACTLPALDQALGELALLSPLYKQTLIDALCATIAERGRVGVTQGELLRAIADALECPLPPLLPGQRIDVAS